MSLDWSRTWSDTLEALIIYNEYDRLSDIPCETTNFIINKPNRITAVQLPKRYRNEFSTRYQSFNEYLKI